MKEELENKTSELYEAQEELNKVTKELERMHDEFQKLKQEEENNRAELEMMLGKMASMAPPEKVDAEVQCEGDGEVKRLAPPFLECRDVYRILRER